MPGKERTRIPRSSPPKTSLKPIASGSSTPHHNVPIPLRGTGKSASGLNPSSSGTGTLPLSLPVRASPSLQASTPNGDSPQVQRNNGSRIPAPLKLQSHVDGAVRPSLPTSTSGSKVIPHQTTSLIRTGRPSFHVPVIHSPASKFVYTTRKPDDSLDTDLDIPHENGRLLGSTVTAAIGSAGEPNQDVLKPTPPNLMRTQTTASNVSSESQYTTQSAPESAEPCDRTQVVQVESNVRDGGKVADEHIIDTTSIGIDCEDESAVLSPGFDVIQALADKDNFQGIDPGVASESSSTPRPRPFSRDVQDKHQPILHPSSSPLVSVVTHNSPSTHETKAHRRSRVAEAAADMMWRNPPTTFPWHSPNTATSSKWNFRTPSLHSGTSGNISDIIDQIESLVGHPCVDIDSVNTTHREAGVRSNTGSPPSAVFGAKLNMTTPCASCTSVLGGQTHTLPLVVFACVEELYRSGLCSSRLLRPPPHASTSTAQSDTLSPSHSHNATHSFPALVASFNTPPSYGDDIDLSLASLDDVGALLLTYLDCLPGGIMPVWARCALGDAVGIYEEGNANGGLDRAKEQHRAILVAQLVLRLIPSPQFSLLVYLLAFLSQIPLYETWNGWNVRGVARAFARVVVGIGAGVRSEDVKRGEKGKDNTHAHRKNDPAYMEDDVNWVTEEEDAVEVLEWLLASWDDLSDGLFMGAQHKEEGERGVDIEDDKGQDPTQEREMHRAAAMRQLDPLHNMRSEDGTATLSSDPAAINASVTALLSRITFLERENAEWQWLQGQHKAELKRMFQEGEQRIAAIEERLMNERNARARAEDALMKGRVILRNTKTNVEDAVRAERALWMGQVQELTKAWEKLGNAWESLGKERDAVGHFVGNFVVGKASEQTK